MPITELDISNIKFAIEAKWPISFPYQGRIREVCPYLLAKTADDRLVLHALQTGGESSKGPVTKPEWRFFYLDQFDRGPGTIRAPWADADIKKSEGGYVPPKFITEVIAIYKE